MKKIAVTLILLTVFAANSIAQNTTFSKSDLEHQSRACALEAFFTLPYRIFPLTYYQRALATLKNEVTISKENGIFKVECDISDYSLLFSRTSGTTTMRSMGCTLADGPIVEVVNSWLAPGMIRQNYSSTYLLVSNKTGWDITQTK